MFQIQKEKFGSFLQYKLFNVNTREFVSILPEWGGIINAFNIEHNGDHLNIIDGYTSADEMQEVCKTIYKSSNLFPFPNRIRDGKYTFEGADYQLPINFSHENNSIHGLIDDQTFEVLEEAQSPIYASLLISHFYGGEHEGYPFPYKLKILYSFNHHNELNVVTLVKNMGDQNMPIGQGWHPYFKTDQDIHELYIKFKPKHKLLLDAQSVPNGLTESFEDFASLKQIGDVEFDTAFELDELSENHEFLIQDQQKNLEIKIIQETGPQKYNFLQIYTPPARKSLAVEPMTCAPDAFNNQMGLISLGPAKTLSFSYQIQVSKILN